jgi:hypothetical protein
LLPQALLLLMLALFLLTQLFSLRWHWLCSFPPSLAIFCRRARTREVHQNTHNLFPKEITSRS